MTGENMKTDIEKEIQRWYDAILAFGKKLTETLKPLFQAIHKACQKIWEICWQEYELHGTPYGKTDKGMLRWLKEMCELARAKAAIEREIAWREGMERLRVQIRIT